MLMYILQLGRIRAIIDQLRSHTRDKWKLTDAPTMDILDVCIDEIALEGLDGEYHMLCDEFLEGVSGFLTENFFGLVDFRLTLLQ